MAHPLKTADIPGTPSRGPTPLLVPDRELRASTRDSARAGSEQAYATLQDTIRETKQRMADTLNAAAPRVRYAYITVSERAVSTVEYLANNGRKWAARTGGQFQRVKQERPLQLLAVVASVAFAAGLALRIWRSKNYE